jgi:quercetin dioxygenase-like cupin family protein
MKKSQASTQKSSKLSTSEQQTPPPAVDMLVLDPLNAPSRIPGTEMLAGHARVVPVSVPLGTEQTRINAIYFEPGSRFRPHVHPYDQILYYPHGTGIVAIAGGEDTIVPEGQFVVLPGNVPHMHGCTSDSPALQLSIMRSVQTTNFEDCPLYSGWKEWYD